jgi:hypothetical protein
MFEFDCPCWKKAQYSIDPFEARLVMALLANWTKFPNSVANGDNYEDMFTWENSLFSDSYA